jgi:hypothetical protein
MAPLYFINKGINKTLERQRAMQQASSNIEQYKERIGLPNISSGQASMLGNNLTVGMYAKGQFFDPMKQQEILKYGLANDMLSGRGRGMASGDIKTFEKNFKELLETVKQVSKTMKTTAEGSMAVIKEMQMGGFGTMGQISNSITSAKAFGSMTGLGMQNILQIGQAGAQAVQGTPFSSVSGANMYMGGAAIAANMARGNNLTSTQAVQSVGGIAQAGGIIAQTQMNIMKTGMGSRILASVMNQQGKLDDSALQNFLQGNQSGHEVIGRAAQVAHGWGTSGRAMAKFNMSDAANQIAENPILMAQTIGAAFNTWRSNKRGDRQAQAYVFAENFVQGGEREQKLFAESLLSGMGIAEMSAQRNVANAVANEKGAYPSLWSRAMRRADNSYVGNALMVGGEKSANLAGDLWSGAGASFTGSARRAAWYTGSAVEAITGRKLWDRRSLGGVEQGYKNLMGLNNVNLSNTALKDLGGLNAVQRRAAGVLTQTGETLGWNAGLIENQSNEDRARFYQTIRTAIGNGSSESILNNATAFKSLGMQNGIQGNSFYERFKKASREQQMQALLNMGNITSSNDTSKLDYATKNLMAVENFVGSLPEKNQQSIKNYLDTKQHWNKDQLAIEMRKVGFGSLKGKSLLALQSYRESQNTINQIGNIDKYIPGQVTSYEMIRKGNQERALKELGLTGDLGPGYVWLAKMGLNRLSGGININRDSGAAETMAAISQKVAEGKYDIYDESKMDKGEVNRIKKERKDLFRAFGISSIDEFRSKFGNDAKDMSDNAMRAKGLQAIVGKNESAIKLLRSNGISGDLIQQTQQYLDIAAKGGILGNAEMSNAVAQTISSNLMVGTTAAEVQKMHKSGELQQRMYNSTKTDIGGSSRIAAIMKEVNRISNSTSKSDYYFQGLGDKDKHVSRSREEALKYALDKYDIEQKVQNMNETVSAEQSKGKSLNGIVASPILNYWNNKWSL